MEIDDLKITCFVIDQFMGKHINLGDWSDIMSVVGKIEEQDNGTKGMYLTTKLRKNEDDGKHSFTIYFNQHPKYTKTASTKKVAAISCIAEYCKDVYITKQVK